MYKLIFSILFFSIITPVLSKDINYIKTYDITDIANEILEQHEIDLNTIVLDIAEVGDKSFVNAIAQKPESNIYFAAIYNQTSNLGGHIAPGCTIFINQKNNKTFVLVEQEYKDFSTGKDFSRYFLTAHELGHCVAGLLGESPNKEEYADFFTLFFLNQSEYKELIPAWINFLAKLPKSHNNYDYITKRKEYILSAQNFNQIKEIFKKYK